jgi:hypothetical protein
MSSPLPYAMQTLNKIRSDAFTGYVIYDSLIGFVDMHNVK